MIQKDTIYKNSQGHLAPFAFNHEVVPVFQDMIQRSVPGYMASIDIMLVLAHQCLTKDDLIYDLGCSLGAASLALHHQASLPSHHIEAIDCSEAMVSALQALIKTHPSPLTDRSLRVKAADILNLKFQRHKMSLLNFVLQFIAMEQRQGILQRIYDALLPQGALVLSEKIAFEDAESAEFHRQLHEEFKSLHGYSKLEIASKRSALDNVLIAETLESHFSRLRAVGFSRVYLALKHLNFVTLVAIK